MVLRVKPKPTRFPANSFLPQWTTHSCILFQVCAARGLGNCCNLASHESPILARDWPPPTARTQVINLVHINYGEINKTFVKIQWLNYESTKPAFPQRRLLGEHAFYTYD